MYFFKASTGHTLYMGKDKFENEDLIRYGLPEDVWFHVDNLSSAHVYLRMNQGEKLKLLPPELIMECCHLVKANSIEGCKMKDVSVVYTRWMNLRKMNSMEVGQVGFKDESKVFKVKVEKNNAIVNALNKTKVEGRPDLQALQEDRATEIRREQKAIRKEQEQREKVARKKAEEDKKLKCYSSLFKESKLSESSNKSNPYGAGEDQSCAEAFEDDFM
mmetsp:Transcript_20279/g.29969  ORF Transcript_20279/g.29969 Transcript_20279/m.29969 type:complete len:217 (-) Transcript_20279:98-748(-)|eukprot:CAMPEP_0171456554 /NCGR_PEP_ID=MMETSP0945-20130129/2991_1 /TAXON_ID=109269 /ORGANISM="Vaucheria litorea, Strain CCMP2940" /LENGTH=216 /DNA_ID=CAMNT_0011981995 /DNA_START=143 /DNA_END=793 /DNA_ORIENTATION=-